MHGTQHRAHGFSAACTIWLREMGYALQSSMKKSDIWSKAMYQVFESRKCESQLLHSCVGLETALGVETSNIDCAVLLTVEM